MPIILGIIDSIKNVAVASWWIISPLVLFFIFWDVRLMYKRSKFIKSIEWTMLEIKIPKDVLKTPKAMEQFFSSMYAVYSHGIKSPAKYLEGKVEFWLSFEMVGYANGVHFYAKIPSRFRNLVESAIYAQYSEAEVKEVEDYTEFLPSVLPNDVYDVWGTTFVLREDSHIPIKTYEFFEEAQEEKRLDPLSNITEVMSNLKSDEMIWIQTLISPTGSATGNDWQAEGKKKIDEIAGRDAKTSKGSSGAGLGEFFRNLIWAPFEHPIWGEETKSTSSSTVKFLHPGEQELVKAIDNKISKMGFETIIRFVYIDKKDSFSPANISAVMGAINQFNTQNLNAFRPSGTTITLAAGWWPKIFPFYKRLKEFSRKRKIFDYYKQRRFGKFNRVISEEFPILNTEELATIYHVPTMMVSAPKLRRTEAKKGEPPIGLPIE